MTIDETIEMLIIESLKRQGGKTFSYNIIKWLEELKEYKSFDLETDMGNSFMSGYNRAIEEVKQLNRERILMLRRAVNSKDENPVLHETLMKSRASEIVIRGDFEIELDELVKHDIKSVECLTKDVRNKVIDDVFDYLLTKKHKSYDFVDFDEDLIELYKEQLKGCAE